MGTSEEKYGEFWTHLLRRWPRCTGYFLRSQVCHGDWLHATAFPSRKPGLSGLEYGFIIRKDQAQVQFYICDGKDRNQHRYAYLLNNRSAIDGQFPWKLKWPHCPGKMVSITAQVSKYGLDDVAKWDEIQNDMIVGMRKLIVTLQPYVNGMLIVE